MNMPAPFLDVAMAAMDSPARPLDFVILQRFENSPLNVEGLRLGALRAAKLYPQTKSCLVEGAWRPSKDWVPVLDAATVQSESARQTELNEFLGGQFDLRADAPLRQCLIQEGPGRFTLATRMHHAAGDLLSALLWLSAQQVDVGSEAPPPVRLKSQAKRVGKSAYAHIGPSTKLWCANRKASPMRRWRSLALEAAPLRAAVQKIKRFTYNDALCTAALEAARKWNHAHKRTERYVSVWLPVNIRVTPFAGFGNGTSRIRVYGRSERTRFVDRCAATREQVAWSKQHGEWVVPKLSGAGFFKILALKAYFNRPWVDMGTILFSHAERTADGQPLPFAEGFKEMDIVANLHSRYPLGIAATSDDHQTRLTFTYDPAQLSDQQVSEFIEMYAGFLRELVA